jgi:hypothetical protein
MIRHALFTAIAIAVVSTALSAQVSPRSMTLPARLDSTGGTMAGCPGGNGIHISATGGTATDSSSGTNTVIGLKQSVDTTLVFDISQKSWTRTDIAAAISLGVADQTSGRYAICAGVAALIPSATLTIRGARGRVHFAASLEDFTNSLRAGPRQ